MRKIVRLAAANIAASLPAIYCTQGGRQAEKRTTKTNLQTFTSP